MAGPTPYGGLEWAAHNVAVWITSDARLHGEAVTLAKSPRYGPGRLETYVTELLWNTPPGVRGDDARTIAAVRDGMSRRDFDDIDWRLVRAEILD
ncbi:hypothetical protein [Streptomyces cacaoi]|uniref:Uncharacterized protein n=1 Tax=Streptomyces cacaoi TaxID=1898 RepID=A0A4Y3QYC7_STRCI|nr:hypothetical protein [Streptomyces cacaoi]GEB50414.1 hypothetical protein SCA03_29650 [Streptomyces cacaoi]